jgi:transposase
MAARVFSAEFRSAIAQRILNGENVPALSTDFKIKRSVLYRWREAYRLAGKDGFKKTRGRPRGSSALVVKTKPVYASDGTGTLRKQLAKSTSAVLRINFYA